MWSDVKCGCNTATQSGPEGMSLTHNLHIGLYSPSMKDIHIGSVTEVDPGILLMVDTGRCITVITQVIFVISLI